MKHAGSVQPALGAIRRPSASSSLPPASGGPMNKRHLLWILVAVQVLLTFASVGAEGFFGWTLPPTLSEYSHSRFAASPLSSPASVFRLLVLLTTSCFAFAGWIGLVIFWRGA